MSDSKTFLLCIYRALTAHKFSYEHGGSLEHVTLRSILENNSGRSRTFYDLFDDGESPLELDTPLETSQKFGSLRQSHNPTAHLTVQDHLETFFYVVFYFTLMGSTPSPTGVEDVGNTLAYIRQNYLEGKGTIITRGSDGISALIASEAHIRLKILDNEPLTGFLKETLLGIWAWYAYHQVIDDGNVLASSSDEAQLPGEDRLFLYDHTGMLRALETALHNIE